MHPSKCVCVTNHRASIGAGRPPGGAAAGQGLLPAADGAAQALLPGRGVSQSHHRVGKMMML